MGIKTGDINIAEEIMESLFLIKKHEMILDAMIRKFSNKKRNISDEDIKNAEKRAKDFLKMKFPNMKLADIY